MDEHVKILVERMVAKIGRNETRRKLVIEGISTSTSEKLVTNRYNATVGSLIGKAIERAFRKLAK